VHPANRVRRRGAHSRQLPAVPGLPAQRRRTHRGVHPGHRTCCRQHTRSPSATRAGARQRRPRPLIAERETRR
jgi:hypothetical protein